MSQQIVNVGATANDGTGTQLRGAFQDVNANFTELYPLRTPIILVDDYGAVGDGTTDDTAAINLAEAARVAGQTLRFTPGKTYAVAQTIAANLLAVLVAGEWDWRGATIKYTGATNLTTGGDGGGYGVVNVLASNTVLRGTIDGNSKANYPVAIKSQVSGVRVDLTVKNTLETTSIWSGIAWAASSDVTGTAISGRAKNVSGFLSHPSCPIVNTSDSIVDHQDITAVLVGGGVTNTNSTGFAIVSGGEQWNCYLAKPDTLGIMQTPKLAEDNTHWMDWVLHDLGANIMELYGHAVLSNNWGLGASLIPGAIFKECVAAWYHTNEVNSSTTPPNALVGGISAGANLAAQQGYGYVAGQFGTGNVTGSAGTSFTPDFSKGSDFVCPANGSPTIHAPANPLVNPTGLSLVQFFNVTVRNTTGGAITTTWDSSYHLAGSWTNPAAGKERSIWFRYDIANGVSYEIGRSAADVTT